MQSQTVLEQKYTPQEYFALEKETGERYEYYNGHIQAMSGGTLNHSLIATNISGEIRQALKNKKSSCVAFNSDLKVHLKTINNYLYPDIMVICGEPQYAENRKDAVENPILVIEVLSKSTRQYDRGDKFGKYRNLPSLREYVLVDQYVPKVESWYKMEENVWRISNAFGLESSIQLYSIDCLITLADIYYMVKGLENAQGELLF